MEKENDTLNYYENKYSYYSKNNTDYYYKKYNFLYYLQVVGGNQESGILIRKL